MCFSKIVIDDNPSFLRENIYENRWEGGTEDQLKYKPRQNVNWASQFGEQFKARNFKSASKDSTH